MVKTQIVQKKAFMWLSEAGPDRSRLREQSQERVLLSFFDSFSLPNEKRMTIKALLEVTLISLRLTAHTVFKKF